MSGTRAGTNLSSRLVSLACLLGASGLAGAASPAASLTPSSAAAADVAWFQATEQRLMDSVAVGDRAVWDQVMDPTCVVTSEEGEVTGKMKFLEELRPLPPGLTGNIVVRELTVRAYAGFAIVRYLADESETVFGQELKTKYRVTDTFRRDGSQTNPAAGAWKLVGSHFAVVTSDPPAQAVTSAAWPTFAGTYRLLPAGWTFTVELRDGKLWGGRDPKKLKPLIPLSPDAFVLSGSLGEWIFVSGPQGKVTHILDYRKFEPLVWTRVDASAGAPGRS